jgi:hypothetical protein
LRAALLAPHPLFGCGANTIQCVVSIVGRELAPIFEDGKKWKSIS